VGIEISLKTKANHLMVYMRLFPASIQIKIFPTLPLTITRASISGHRNFIKYKSKPFDGKREAFSCQHSNQNIPNSPTSIFISEFPGNQFQYTRKISSSHTIN
jgi:hypothetical protein